jgi:hypothetical protein
VLLFAWPIAAQDNCRTQPKPPKPFTPAGCIDTTPTCLCAGTVCNWIWACVPRGLPSVAAPAPLPSGTSSGIDATIPLQVRPMQMPDLMDIYRKAVEVQNLQLREQSTRQQIRAQEQTRQQAEPQPTLPAVSGPFTTGGLYNGHLWKAVDYAMKEMWVRGYCEGLTMAFSVSAGTDPNTAVSRVSRTENLFPTALTYPETIAAVDRLYASSENEPIPISFVLQATVMKISGIGQPQIDEFMAAGRR